MDAAITHSLEYHILNGHLDKIKALSVFVSLSAMLYHLNVRGNRNRESSSSSLGTVIGKKVGKCDCGKVTFDINLDKLSRVICKSPRFQQAKKINCNDFQLTSDSSILSAFIAEDEAVTIFCSYCGNDIFYAQSQKQEGKETPLRHH